MTAETNNIYSAISAIIGDLCVEGVGKDGYNPQGGYNYRSIGNIMTHVARAQAKRGVFIAAEDIGLEITEKTVKNGSTLSVTRVTVSYRACASDGSFINLTSVGEGVDYGDKGTPKAMTAAYKTMLSQLYCIPFDPDPDAESPEHNIHPKGEESIPRITEEQVIKLQEYVDQLKNKEGFKAWLKRSVKANDLADINTNSYESVLAQLVKATKGK